MPFLAPLRANLRRQRSADVKFMPAPSGGWNARDDLSDMDATDAIVLDNLIPTESGVKVRSGYAEHVTGLGSPPQSLMEYNPPAASPALFAATDDAVYNVSAAGAVGAADLSSLSNGWWQHTMIATSGGTFLVMVNGADGLRTYDGSSWTNQTGSVTGVNANDFIVPMGHLNRLWFIEADTLDVWYLPAGQLNGAANKLALGAFSKLGGKLMGMATWTRDGGDGTDDYAVFVTSRGEVHIYGGTDPSSSTTWARVGTFKIAEPVGYRSIIRAGSDLGVVTALGVVPLGPLLAQAVSGQSAQAATNKIANAFRTAYADGAGLNGWQIVEWASEQLVIVNVPSVENTTSVQYVANAGNGGRWCRWTEVSANCWSPLGADMYFGGHDGTIYKMTGSEDNGEAITWTLVQAFSDFGTPNQKFFKRIKPQFFGPPGYSPRVGLRTDYDDRVITFQAPAFTSQGPEWDVAEWDVDAWGASQQPSFGWQGVVGDGFVAAVIVTGSTIESVTYNGSKVLFEVGDDY